MIKKDFMKKINFLNHKFMRRKLDANKLNFKMTTELKLLNEFIGQERALQAISFGLETKNQGFNLYAMGPPGIGKRSLIKIILKEKSKKKNVPFDWCYIHNFEDPEKPIALQLPPGLGVLLKEDMQILINNLSTSILSVFESDEYRNRLKNILEDFNNRKNEVKDNTHTDFKIIQLYKKRHINEKKLQLRMTANVVKPIIKKLKDKYEKYKQVIKFLRAIERDIIINVGDFIKYDESTNIISFLIENTHLIKYQVNVLVDHSKKKQGAPIIIEENPSYSNLVCRVEYSSQLGTTSTNFTLIKPGSLHLANGGYLIIEARKLKKEKIAWEALKRALYTKKITIEPIEHTSDTFNPISVNPMPIPLNVKVVLLGTRRTYYSLSEHDPDFNELFKVTVDFDEHITRSKKNINLYARLIGTIAHKENLKPLNAEAVAEIIDYSSRLAHDNQKLSAHIRSIYDLVIESNYFANKATRKIIQVKDVKGAIKAQTYRLDRVRELYYEEIERHFVHINTHGKTIGQINCLSVLKIGRFSFGNPLRVTATARLGKTKMVDIQREIDMAGPIHSKAGLTIINFLGNRYGKNNLFSLHASISFEQVYGAVEGDSASVGEVCALLSVLAEMPINQCLAVTGSLDQYGNVQTVGAVNEKIEGFFDICLLRGLNGKQGVIIPAININNLMLKEEVVKAAKANQFFIYPIKTIDDAIQLLMINDQNNKIKDFNEKIEKKLLSFSKKCS